jgi:hypothetical protein
MRHCDTFMTLWHSCDTKSLLIPFTLKWRTKPRKGHLLVVQMHLSRLFCIRPWNTIMANHAHDTCRTRKKLLLVIPNMVRDANAGFCNIVFLPAFVKWARNKNMRPSNVRTSVKKEDVAFSHVLLKVNMPRAAFNRMSVWPKRQTTVIYWKQLQLSAKERCYILFPTNAGDW